MYICIFLIAILVVFKGIVATDEKMRKKQAQKQNKSQEMQIVKKVQGVEKKIVKDIFFIF